MTVADRDLLSDLAAGLRAAFGAAAASVSLLSSDGPPLVVCTPPEREPLEQLQLRRGRGPVPAVITSGQVVAIPDVAVRAEAWPDYARAARVAGISSALGVPLLEGPALIGVLVLYGTTPQDHTPGELQMARIIADLLAVDERGLRSDRGPMSGRVGSQVPVCDPRPRRGWRNSDRPGPRQRQPSRASQE
ncbi:GAF domain-containing protein [Nocardioides sp. QY071]|uniref:GAF domain-containing protein n=1 Tax=Nocardioides sp. QY071 TaxID=3044187 RepID=UPI00249B94A4|nr:GAF domain-containing protein [Nocardioides sp. QY071]WGY04529.1 GAF domain-containing protein [Nocardioides sp. QY071]